MDCTPSWSREVKANYALNFKKSAEKTYKIFLQASRHATVFKVEVSIISKTEKGEAGEGRYQQHVHRVCDIHRVDYCEFPRGRTINDQLVLLQYFEASRGGRSTQLNAPSRQFVRSMRVTNASVTARPLDSFVSRRIHPIQLLLPVHRFRDESQGLPHSHFHGYSPPIAGGA